MSFDFLTNESVPIVVRQVCISKTDHELMLNARLFDFCACRDRGDVEEMHKELAKGNNDAFQRGLNLCNRRIEKSY